MEGILIEVLEPKLNKQGAKFGDGIEQYYQNYENEEPSLFKIGNQLEEISKQLEKLS